MASRGQRSQRRVPSFLGVTPPASFLRTRTVVVGLVVILIWVGVFTGREWARRSQVESEIVRIQEEIAQIETAGKELEKTLRLFTQPEMIEREARRRLNLVRSGETVVVIPDEGEAFSFGGFVAENNVASVVTQQGTGPLVNVIAWWSYFFSEESRD